MTAVYFLYHIDDQKLYDGEYHYGKLVGVYSSIDRARAAIRELRDRQGFIDYPECWRIYKRTLDRDSWTKGFVAETHERIQ
jgi:hypothetical protein